LAPVSASRCRVSTASGPVDYALFVASELCGVIAAKPADTTLSGFADEAARDIADVPGHLIRREGQIRFEYAASGGELLFRDRRPGAARAARFLLPSSRDPAALACRRRHHPPRLQAMPPLVTEGLRDCQPAAVAGARSVARRRQTGVRSSRWRRGPARPSRPQRSATGFLEHGKFRRILFLADRASLVRQARDEFLAYRPPATDGAFAAPLEIQKLGPDDWTTARRSSFRPSGASMRC